MFLFLNPLKLVVFYSMSPIVIKLIPWTVLVLSTGILEKGHFFSGFRMDLIAGTQCFVSFMSLQNSYMG